MALEVSAVESQLEAFCEFKVNISWLRMDVVEHLKARCR